MRTPTAIMPPKNRMRLIDDARSLIVRESPPPSSVTTTMYTSIAASAAQPSRTRQRMV